MLQALTQLVASARYRDLPDAAVSAAQTFLLDSLAIGVAGCQSPYRESVRNVALRWGQGEQAQVWGEDLHVPATTAAFINTFQMHCLEFDCVHEPAVAHVMTAVAGAALAECERQGGCDGQRLLTALVVGVEVASTLGLAANAPLSFFRPATTGVFGALAAVASLRKFDAEQTRNGFGYALSQAAGTMQAHEEGKPTLPMQLAAAARAGLVSADLAETGIEAPAQVLDGRYGYFALFETDTDVAGLAALVGNVWRVTELSHKPFPSGRATHGGVEAVLQLREQGIAADNVVDLHLQAPALIHQLVIRPPTADMNVNYARLCFPYVGAVALRFGSVDLAHFAEESLRDAQTQSLAQKFTASISTATDPSAFTPQTLVATRQDGSKASATIRHLLGSPDHPLSTAACYTKVERCLASVYSDTSRAFQLAQSVQDLPRLTDAREILTPITGTPG